MTVIVDIVIDATSIQGTTLIAFGGDRVALCVVGEILLGDEVWNVVSRDFSIRMYCVLSKSATESTIGRGR